MKKTHIPKCPKSVRKVSEKCPKSVCAKTLLPRKCVLKCTPPRAPHKTRASQLQSARDHLRPHWCSLWCAPWPHPSLHRIIQTLCGQRFQGAKFNQEFPAATNFTVGFFLQRSFLKYRLGCYGCIAAARRLLSGTSGQLFRRGAFCAIPFGARRLRGVTH